VRWLAARSPLEIFAIIISKTFLGADFSAARPTPRAARSQREKELRPPRAPSRWDPSQRVGIPTRSDVDKQSRGPQHQVLAGEEIGIVERGAK